MINLPSGTRIWLVAGVTDMRKSFNGLGELVQHALDENPFSGHLFIFRGRKGDTVKILWADADGLWPSRCDADGYAQSCHQLLLNASPADVTCR